MVTVTLDGEERDVPTRAEVLVEPSRSRGWSAWLDGSAEVFVGNDWRDLDETGLDAQDIARICDALMSLALEDG